MSIPFASTWIHIPVFGEIRVTHLFDVMCCVFVLLLFVLNCVHNFARGLSILDCHFGFL
jgi:hypothetical protein